MSVYKELSLNQIRKTISSRIFNRVLIVINDESIDNYKKYNLVKAIFETNYDSQKADVLIDLVDLCLSTYADETFVKRAYTMCCRRCCEFV